MAARRIGYLRLLRNSAARGVLREELLSSPGLCDSWLPASGRPVPHRSSARHFGGPEAAGG